MLRPGAVRRSWILLLLILGTRPSWAEEPVIEMEDNSWLVLTSLPSILSDDQVAPHLTKGLTTTFIFVVDLVGVAAGKRAGGARIEIRYELWDEVFHTTTVDISGSINHRLLESHDDLLAWWADSRLKVVRRESAGAAMGDLARVRLEVIPFSQSEERDTQEWFAESVSAAELSRNQGASTSVEGSSADHDGVFSILIATSIRRRPLTTFRWTLDLPRERSP